MHPGTFLHIHQTEAPELSREERVSLEWICLDPPFFHQICFSALTPSFNLYCMFVLPHQFKCTSDIQIWVYFGSEFRIFSSSPESQRPFASTGIQVSQSVNSDLSAAAALDMELMKIRVFFLNEDLHLHPGSGIFSVRLSINKLDFNWINP